MSPAIDSIKYVPAGNVLVRVAVLLPPVEVITVNDVPPDKLEKLSVIIQPSSHMLRLCI